MGRWSIWGGRTHRGGTRERVGGCWPNNSTIVRSLIITSIADIKLTTTTIGSIILFQFRVLGLQIIFLNGFMPTSWHWQRSMQIAYGGTWSAELMWSLRFKVCNNPFIMPSFGKKIVFIYFHSVFFNEFPGFEKQFILNNFYSVV